MATITASTLLEDCNKAIRNLLKDGTISATVDGKTYTFANIDELRRLRDALKQEVYDADNGTFTFAQFSSKGQF